MTDIVLAAGGGLGALALGAIIKLFIGPAIEYSAARILGRVWRRGQYDVRGTWKSTYDYVSAGRVRKADQLMTFVQIGNTIYGKNIGGRSSHKHVMKLTLDGPYITGTWRNTAQGAGHHGVAQFRIRAQGNEMNGKWVGFDGDSNIQSGSWKMVRQ